MTTPNTAKYLAIGTPLGPLIINEDDTSLTNFIRVDNNGGYMRLPSEPYRVWLSALDGIAPEEFESILLKESGEDDCAENLKWLIDTHLIVLWDPEATDFSDYPNIRVVPCGGGLGEDPNEPGIYTIVPRHESTAVLRVDFPTYVLWNYCNGLKSLSDACQATVDDLGDLFSLDQVRRRAVMLVPGLLSQQLAFLELASAELQPFGATA
jgi:hypothetical protein